MTNGKGRGFLASALLVVLVAAFGVVLFFFGAYVEDATGGGVTGLLAAGQAAEQGGGLEQEGAGDGASEASGAVLYDGEGMKVTYGGLENVDAAGVSILSLIVENKTGRDVSCIAEPGTLSVNDFNVDPVGGAQIQAGKSGVAQFTLSHKQANISGTDGIASVSMNLELITLGETIDTLASAPISITF